MEYNSPNLEIAMAQTLFLYESICLKGNQGYHTRSPLQWVMTASPYVFWLDFLWLSCALLLVLVSPVTTLKFLRALFVEFHITLTDAPLGLWLITDKSAFLLLWCHLPYILQKKNWKFQDMYRFFLLIKSLSLGSSARSWR